MSTLVAIIYKHQPEAAAITLDRLRDLQEEYLIDLEDAVVVRRNPKGKLTLQQAFNPTARGAAMGSLWGLLIGTVFGGAPGMLVGAAFGGGLGAISGSLDDFGISDEFVKSLSSEVESCCSALFVLARSLTTDKVIAELAGTGGAILKTSLPIDVESRLQRSLQAGLVTTSAPLGEASARHSGAFEGHQNGPSA